MLLTSPKDGDQQAEFERFPKEWIVSLFGLVHVLTGLAVERSAWPEDLNRSTQVFHEHRVVSIAGRCIYVLASAEHAADVYLASVMIPSHV